MLWESASDFVEAEENTWLCKGRDQKKVKESGMFANHHKENEIDLFWACVKRSGIDMNIIIQGIVEGERGRGRSRRMDVDDIIEEKGTDME